VNKKKGKRKKMTCLFFVTSLVLRVFTLKKKSLRWIGKEIGGMGAGFDSNVFCMLFLFLGSTTVHTEHVRSFPTLFFSFFFAIILLFPQDHSLSQRMIEESFGSERKRLAFVKSVRQGLKGHNVTDHSLRFDLHLPLENGMCFRLLINKQSTQTLIFQSLDPRPSRIILKVFAIPSERTESRDELVVHNHDVEVAFLTLGELLVTADICPHFVLPIAWSINSRASLDSILPLEYNESKTDYMCLFAERADCSLHDLLKRKQLSEYALKNIIFQVILTLAILQDMFPSFRHNDLHCGNILIHVMVALNHFVHYEFFKQDYYSHVGTAPFRCLLWDAFFASVLKRDCKSFTTLVPSRTTISSDPLSKTVQNKYYDVHKFLDTLHGVLTCADTKTVYPDSVRRFVHEVIPEPLRGLNHNEKAKIRLFENEVTSASAVLGMDFFDEFRKHPNTTVFLKRYTYPLQTGKKPTGSS
jgi:hypothetical protein